MSFVLTKSNTIDAINKPTYGTQYNLLIVTPLFFSFINFSLSLSFNSTFFFSISRLHHHYLTSSSHAPNKTSDFLEVSAILSSHHQTAQPNQSCVWFHRLVDLPLHNVPQIFNWIQIWWLGGPLKTSSASRTLFVMCA